ncbi:MAG TPA: hypothetical protein PKC80_03470 [Burkholderiaceae bacterium]|nr:hypothetical protein [Burkholderiaceae bacterium]
MNATLIKIVTKAVEAALPAVIDTVQKALRQKKNFAPPMQATALDPQWTKIQTTLAQNTRHIKALERQVQRLAALMEKTKPIAKLPAAKKPAVKKPAVKRSSAAKSQPKK